MMSAAPSCPFVSTLSTPRLDLFIHNSSPEHYRCLINCFNTPSALKYLGDWNVHTHADIDKLFNGTMLQRKLIKGHADVEGYIQEGCHYHIRPKPGNPGAGELVGGVSLGQRGDDVPPDIGWALLDGYGGNGYATEAATELLRYLREELGINEIIAWPNPANVASMKIAEKIGMVRGGDVKDKDNGQIQAVFVLEGMKWPFEDGLELSHMR